MYVCAFFDEQESNIEEYYQSTMRWWRRTFDPDPNSVTDDRLRLRFAGRPPVLHKSGAVSSTYPPRILTRRLTSPSIIALSSADKSQCDDDDGDSEQEELTDAAARLDTATSDGHHHLLKRCKSALF
jgi:hypothetical protein